MRALTTVKAVATPAARDSPAPPADTRSHRDGGKLGPFCPPAATVRAAWQCRGIASPTRRLFSCRVTTVHSARMKHVPSWRSIEACASVPSLFRSSIFFMFSFVLKGRRQRAASLLLLVYIVYSMDWSGEASIHSRLLLQR